jgi:hypothetical protein
MSMKVKRITISGLVLAMLAGAAWRAQAIKRETVGEPAQEEFRWRGQVAAGRTVEVKGINGEVRAEPSTGNEVEVHAVKRGRRSDPRGVEIKVVEHEGGVTICAVYPSRDPDRPNECQPGSRGRMSVRDNDVRVDFIVRVPAAANFIGRTVNGKIEALSLNGNIEAYTVNGSIDVSTAGFAQAHTVNGSINATIGNADWKTLDFETVNGSINLTLPGATSTEVEAGTVNGSISTDFPLTVQGSISRRKLSGTIGNGGRELKLSTVNGGIRLRRSNQ